MSIATTRMTVGSLLGAVNEAATAVSSTFTAATRGIGMLNTYVTEAAENQRERTIVNRDQFRHRLIEEASMQEAQRRVAVLDFINTSDVNKELYSSAYSRLSKLLNVEEVQPKSGEA